MQATVPKMRNVMRRRQISPIPSIMPIGISVICIMIQCLFGLPQDPPKITISIVTFVMPPSVADYTPSGDLFRQDWEGR